MANLIFPLDLNNSGVGMKRPMVVFSQSSAKVAPKDTLTGNLNIADNRIYLPIPQLIAVSDKSDYTAKALGLAGKAVQQAMNGGTATTAVDKIQTGLKEMNINRFAAAAISGLGSTFSPEIASAANIGSGTVPNPYLMTEFSGVETRQFTFNFKLIPSSEDEAKTIKKIISTFRLGIYPKANIFQLTYPPTWIIRFIAHNPNTDPKDDSFEDIEYIPKIFETFLVDAQATFNTSGNMWRVDGAPLETDLVLSFMETRALTHRDVELLEKYSYSRAVFDMANTEINNFSNTLSPASIIPRTKVNAAVPNLPPGAISTTSAGRGVTSTTGQSLQNLTQKPTASTSNLPPSALKTILDAAAIKKAEQDAIDIKNGLLPDDFNQ